MNPSGFYVDPIFSIALLLDESFLNISIKKAVPPNEIHARLPGMLSAWTKKDQITELVQLMVLFINKQVFFVLYK